MPGVPIEMPSDTVMVPKVVLLPPAALAPLAAASASLRSGQEASGFTPARIDWPEMRMCRPVTLPFSTTSS
mgnify:CR=1 FL=1